MIETRIGAIDDTGRIYCAKCLLRYAGELPMAGDKRDIYPGQTHSTEPCDGCGGILSGLGPRTCPHCGELFSPSWKDEEYCGTPCAIAAHAAKPVIRTVYTVEIRPVVGDGFSGAEPDDIAKELMDRATCRVIQLAVEEALASHPALPPSVASVVNGLSVADVEGDIGTVIA